MVNPRNPYFVAWAVAHRMHPDLMPIDGYIVWITERWAEWAPRFGLTRTGSGFRDVRGRHAYPTDEQRADFVGWVRGYAMRMALGDAP